MVLLLHGVKQATAALVTVSASSLLEAGVSPLPPPQAVKVPPSKPTIKVFITVLFIYRSCLVFSWPIRIEIRWNFQIAIVAGGSQLVLRFVQYHDTTLVKRGDNSVKK